MIYYGVLYLPRSWRGLLTGIETEEGIVRIVVEKLQEAIRVAIGPENALTILEGGFNKAYETPLHDAPEWTSWSHVSFTLEFPTLVDESEVVAAVTSHLPERTHFALWR